MAPEVMKEPSRINPDERYVWRQPRYNITDLISRRHLLVSIRCRSMMRIHLEHISQSCVHLGIDICNFFDSTTLARPTVGGRDYTSVCSLAKFFDILIFRVNHEGGIQGSEAVSLHILWLCSERKGRVITARDMVVDLGRCFKRVVLCNRSLSQPNTDNQRAKVTTAQLRVALGSHSILKIRTPRTAAV